jgi:formylglycine-generating enzyme required for sulfatase activity
MAGQRRRDREIGGARPGRWWRLGGLLGAGAWLLWLLPVTSVTGQQPFDIDRARRAVVRVLGEGGNRPGSGTVISVSGGRAYVLTARHVIAADVQRGAQAVEVEFYPDEVRKKARLSGSRMDVGNDLAVLIVDDLPEPPPPEMPWASSEAVDAAQRVWAVGHLIGGVSWAVTEGTVAQNLGGKIYFSGTAVDKGNSGGPLLGAQGALVGVVTGEGGAMGVAVESNLVRTIVRGWVPSLAPAGVMEMVLVPAGDSWMGSEDGGSEERPRRKVYLDGFYIDRTEVTNAQYRRFMEATGQRAPAYWGNSRFNAPDQPVVGVDWGDARAYCAWAGKRLPTEAEWEKTARGPDGRRYPWGDEWDPRKANFAEGGPGKPTPVGSYRAGASPYGAVDMAGNVWEWVADWYQRDYYTKAPSRNPPGPDQGALKVLRGGSWYDYPFDLRAAYRSFSTPDFRITYIGFRCARGS